MGEVILHPKRQWGNLCHQFNSTNLKTFREVGAIDRRSFLCRTGTTHLRRADRHRMHIQRVQLENWF